MSLPFRPHLNKIRAYDTGKPIRQLMGEIGVAKFINLAANENPWGPSPRAIEALNSAAGTINRYPQGPSTDLRDAISKLAGVSPEQIFVGNGSDECIRMIAECLLDSPSDEILVGDPTFVCYADAAQNRNCRVIKVDLDGNRKIDLAQIAGQVSTNTKIIYLSNPNNPTGTYFSESELRTFLDRVRDSIAVVLDEAYFEYAVQNSDYPNSVDLLEKYQNVIVLRTFSKAYGLAGLRCGYGVASEEFVQFVNRIRMPFNVSSIAQAACMAAIQDQEYVSEIVVSTEDGKKRLRRVLESVGARVFDSAANFVYAEFESESAQFVHNLMKQGILVRGCAAFGSPSGVRISVGTESEIDQLESAIANFPQEQNTL